MKKRWWIQCLSVDVARFLCGVGPPSRGVRGGPWEWCSRLEQSWTVPEEATVPGKTPCPQRTRRTSKKAKGNSPSLSQERKRSWEKMRVCVLNTGGEKIPALHSPFSMPSLKLQDPFLDIEQTYWIHSIIKSSWDTRLGSQDVRIFHKCLLQDVSSLITSGSSFACCQMVWIAIAICPDWSIQVQQLLLIRTQTLPIWAVLIYNSMWFWKTTYFSEFISFCSLTTDCCWISNHFCFGWDVWNHLFQLCNS